MPKILHLTEPNFNYNTLNINSVLVNSIDQNPERQLEGIALAKEKGKYKGRKPALNDASTIAYWREENSDC